MRERVPQRGQRTGQALGPVRMQAGQRHMVSIQEFQCGTEFAYEDISGYDTHLISRRWCPVGQIL
jgi:hypothetical protein